MTEKKPLAREDVALAADGGSGAGHPAPGQVVLASGNQGKLREFSALLQPLGFTLKTQNELGVVPPDETGRSFLENALIKARSAADQTGMAVLADDSGLCVDALGGAPGILSARYAGPDGSGTDLCKKLLCELSGVPESARTARFCCALCFLSGPDDPVPVTAMGIWEGRIGTRMRGSGGFGYDPVFMVPGRGVSAAELSVDLKNLISHRARALQELIARLISARIAAGSSDGR